MTAVEVFADITCPFAHVGLQQVVEHVDETGRSIEIHVLAWPLEWVNGVPLAADAVMTKAQVLREQLGTDAFGGLRPDRWPATTIPALGLTHAAYEQDPATGLAVSLALRAALFESGLDIGDPSVLAAIAADHGIAPPIADATAVVRAEYDDGQARGVRGSPHFFVGADDFFCPALDLGHDDDGHLTASFDPAGLAAFFARVDA